MSYLVESVVIPILAGRREREDPALQVIDPRVAELAGLLIATDATAASLLARELSALAGSLAFARSSLFEPTARSLGDLWHADECSGVELDIALVRLQKMVRELCDVALPTSPTRFAVLVAPTPGEPHMLGAALDSELLWRAGWNTRTEFPRTDAALHALVGAEWFDALDLSLSSALRREDAVPRLERTIASARVASRNPALIVVVGGRIFTERDNLAESVGADLDFSRVLQLGASIEEALRRPRSTERRKESVVSIEKRRVKNARPR